MSVEEEMVAHLEAHAPLVALLSDRIYPLVAPQDCKTPYIRYQNINDADVTSVQGDNYENKILMQIDVFSTSYKEVKEILGAVKVAMYEFKHFPHDFNARDGYEQETKLHRQLIQFKLNI